MPTPTYLLRVRAPDGTGRTQRRLKVNEPNWQIEVFYDGQCPLCRREIDMIRRRDARGDVRLTDIMASDFDALSYGKSLQQFMDRIQGRLPDGSWVQGVEVFRLVYGALGFKRLASWSRLPGIAHVLDWGYETFARNRLRWTGRCESNGDCRLQIAGES